MSFQLRFVSIRARLRSALIALPLLASLAAPAAALDFQFNAGAGVTPAALAALERAATQWESLFSDPITVLVDVDLDDFSADADPGNDNVLGQAATSLITADHDTFVGLLTGDAGDETDDTIVLSLPNAAGFNANVPSGFSLSGDLTAASASLKALGIAEATINGLTPGGVDASIIFNSNYPFDYDNSNGFDSGSFDFETIAVHELGHTLGWVSSVDKTDAEMAIIAGGGTGNTVITPSTVDLFRFASAPANATAFNSDTRELTPGLAAVLADEAELGPVSTGATQGDGRQASHWKDDFFTSTLLGVLDPTFGPEMLTPISFEDARVLDLIGYEFVPEPGTGSLLLVGLGVLAAGNRRRALR